MASQSVDGPIPQHAEPLVNILGRQAVLEPDALFQVG